MYLLKTTLNANNKLVVELHKIYGIHHSYTNQLCKDLGIKPQCLITSLTPTQRLMIQHWFQLKLMKTSLKVNDDLKKFMSDRKQELITLKTYRGSRHKDGLPSRGQRTHTNAKSQRSFKQSKQHSFPLKKKKVTLPKKKVIPKKSSKSSKPTKKK